MKIDYSSVVLEIRRPRNRTYADMGGYQDYYHHFLFLTLVAIIVLTPMTLFGLATNILNLVVLRKKSNENSDFARLPLFFYWKVESMVAIVATVNYQALWICNAYNRLIFELNSYVPMFFTAHINPYVTNTTGMIRAYLDIIILLDRIAIFRPRIKQILFRLPPWANCLIITALSMLVSVSAIFNNMVYSRYLSIFGAPIVVLYGSGQNRSFNQSTLGIVAGYIRTILRSVLPLSLELPLNLYSVYLFRSYMNKKRKIAGVESNKTERTMTGLTDQKSSHTHLEHQTVRDESNEQDRAVRNLYIMAFILSAVSIIQQSIAVAFFIYTLIFGNLYTFQFFVDASLCLKHSLNFIILYFFNKEFKKSCKAMFTC